MYTTCDYKFICYVHDLASASSSERAHPRPSSQPLEAISQRNLQNKEEGSKQCSFPVASALYKTHSTGALRMRPFAHGITYGIYGATVKMCPL